MLFFTYFVIAHRVDILIPQNSYRQELWSFSSNTSGALKAKDGLNVDNTGAFFTTPRFFT